MNVVVAKKTISRLALLCATMFAVSCADDDNSGANTSTENGTSSNGEETNLVDMYPIGPCDGDMCPNATECVASDSERVAFSVCETGSFSSCPNVNEDQRVGECQSDTDCVRDGQPGYCHLRESCGGAGICSCNTQCEYDACATDTDCAEDELCLLRGTQRARFNACIPFRCQTDADCTDEEGGECRLLGSGAFAAIVCAYPSDACREPSDCPSTCDNSDCAPRFDISQSNSVLREPIELVCFDDESCALP